MVELFSIREAFSFVIKVWKWGEKVFVSKQHQEAQQCNANLPTLSVHGNPTDAAKTPGLLRNLFPCVFLHCFANLEDVIVWPASDINNCGSPIYLFFFFIR